MTIAYKTIREAFDFVSFCSPGSLTAYICLQTGKSYLYSEYGDNEEDLPDDINDLDKYIVVPQKSDLDLGRKLAFNFVDTYLPNESQKVWAIFKHQGAYSRFKMLLEEKGMLEQWYGFEDEKMDAGLREWCQIAGIAVEE